MIFELLISFCLLKVSVGTMDMKYPSIGAVVKGIALGAEGSGFDSRAG